MLVRGTLKEKLQWIFRFFDIDEDGKLTKQVDQISSIDFHLHVYFDKTLETILRSLYDLLGPNMYLHEPVMEGTIEKHSALVFEQLDPCHHGSVNLDEFEKYCLDVCRENINKRSRSIFDLLLLLSRMNK